MYFFPLWWGLDWSKWGRGLARNIIYNQNIIVINDKCSCSEDIHKKFFFSTLRRVWLIKGRRGGGGGLAGNRDFPGYIPVLSPTVNPINQSIKAMECFSEWYQTSFRGMSKWSLLIYLDIMVLTKTEKLNAITSMYHISQSILATS